MSNVELDHLIGTGATYHVGSDRYACTIIAVSKTKYKITVQLDKAIRIDNNGCNGPQTYRFERDRGAPEYSFVRNKRGKYANRTRNGHLSFERDHYRDSSF